MSEKKILIAERSPEFSRQLSQAPEDGCELLVCHSGRSVKDLPEEFEPAVPVTEQYRRSMEKQA